MLVQIARAGRAEIGLLSLAGWQPISSVFTWYDMVSSWLVFGQHCSYKNWNIHSVAGRKCDVILQYQVNVSSNIPYQYIALLILLSFRSRMLTRFRARMALYHASLGQLWSHLALWSDIISGKIGTCLGKILELLTIMLISTTLKSVMVS